MKTPRNIVLKPGPARWVDPGPGRPGPETGPGLSKNPFRSWPGETRSTRRVDPEPGRPGQTRLRPGYLPFFCLLSIQAAVGQNRKDHLKTEEKGYKRHHLLRF